MKASLETFMSPRCLKFTVPTDYNGNECYHFPQLIAITRRNLSENGRQESKSTDGNIRETMRNRYGTSYSDVTRSVYLFRRN